MWCLRPSRPLQATEWVGALGATSPASGARSRPGGSPRPAAGMPRRRRLQRPARGRFKGGRAGGRGGRPRAALGSIQKLLPATPRRRGAQGGGAAASARGAPEAENGRPPGPALRQFGPPWPPQEARSAAASRPPSAPDAPPRPGPGPRPPDGRARASRATAGRAAGPSTAGRPAWPRGRSCTARWPRAGAASSGRAPSGTDPRWTCSCPWASRGRARKCGLQPGSPALGFAPARLPRPPASGVPWGPGGGSPARSPRAGAGGAAGDARRRGTEGSPWYLPSARPRPGAQPVSRGLPGDPRGGAPGGSGPSGPEPPAGRDPGGGGTEGAGAGGWRSVPSPPSRRSGAGGAAFLDGEEGARRSGFSSSPGDLGSRFSPVVDGSADTGCPRGRRGAVLPCPSSPEGGAGRASAQVAAQQPGQRPGLWRRRQESLELGIRIVGWHRAQEPFSLGCLQLLGGDTLPGSLWRWSANYIPCRGVGKLYWEEGRGSERAPDLWEALLIPY